jgi:hypothetical protein
MKTSCASKNNLNFRVKTLSSCVTWEDHLMSMIINVLVFEVGINSPCRVGHTEHLEDLGTRRHF